MEIHRYGVSPGQTMTTAGPLIYTIGLDALVARAIYADMANADIRRRRPLGGTGPRGRLGRRPDVLLLDLCLAGLEAELAAARAAWGQCVLIVGVDRCWPLARVWQGQTLATVVEMGPGFLPSLLGQARPIDRQSWPRID